MKPTAPSKWDRLLARVCVACPVCRAARRRQRGVAYWLVRKVEGKGCPFCRAYAKVYQHQAHEANAAERPEATGK